MRSFAKPQLSDVEDNTTTQPDKKKKKRKRVQAKSESNDDSDSGEGQLEALKRWMRLSIEEKEEIQSEY